MGGDPANTRRSIVQFSNTDADQLTAYGAMLDGVVAEMQPGHGMAGQHQPGRGLHRLGRIAFATQPGLGGLARAAAGAGRLLPWLLVC